MAMNCAAMVWRWLTVIVVRKGLDMAWYIDGSASMGNLDVFQTDERLGDYRVCMIDCDDETVSESDHEANARLISAAPDLLAVVCEMLGAAETDLLDETSNVWRSAMISARAAIAKAEGEAR